MTIITLSNKAPPAAAPIIIGVLSVLAKKIMTVLYLINPDLLSCVSVGAGDIEITIDGTKKDVEDVTKIVSTEGDGLLGVAPGSVVKLFLLLIQAPANGRPETFTRDAV